MASIPPFTTRPVPSGEAAAGRLRRLCSAAARYPRLSVLSIAFFTAIVSLAAYARFAPLASPYARLDAPGSVVLGADGTVLARDTSAGLHIPVALDQIAPVLIDATIVTEDERFRRHPGVDPVSILRAAVTFPFSRSGASTLTQQLARRLYLADFKGSVIERKAREALIALQLEARYSKDEILSLYLNNVYYGQGAYGVEAAARVYFGVSARNLDIAQAAFLAGLPQRPSVYGARPESALTRQRTAYVLGRLLASGRISAAEAGAAATEALQLLPPLTAVAAPHFVAYTLDELARERPDLATRRDLVIETTLDTALQQETQSVLSYQIDLLRDREAGNGAVVVLEPATGRILTMAGSVDFGDTAIGGQHNMTLTPRQPGSALKPFLYLAALENGYTAATPLLDVPASFTTTAGLYEPLNYDRRFNGVVPLRVALASSLNVPAVRTLDQLGLDAFLDMAHRFGLGTLTDAEVYGLSLTLGGGEVRLLDLTAAYAALANLGAAVEPHAIARVRDGAGRVLFERPPARPRQVVAAEDAFVIADILSDAMARRLGFGASSPLDLPFKAAVKTGTTTEFRDNWAVGFTAERAVGVWVGNADNRPMKNVSGVTGAAPIWHAVMEAAHATPPSWPAPPDDLLRATVCTPTGLLPGPDCPTKVSEWFRPGSAPVATEDYYQRDAAGRLVIDPPTEARAWAAAAGLPLAAASSSAGQAGLAVFPAPGSRFFLAPEVPDQAIMLRATAPAGARGVEYWLDGSLVGRALPNAGVRWPVVAGDHLLEARFVDDEGRTTTVSSRFQVTR